MLPTLISHFSVWMFAVSFLLAVRSHTMARLLGGFAWQHRLHHYAGLATALLVCTHVTVEFAAIPPSLWAEYLSLTDPALLAAWTAFLLLLGASGASFLKAIRFVRWRWIHRLFWLSVAGGLVHGFLFSSLDPPRLASLVMVVMAVALAGFVPRIQSLRQKRHIFRVSRVNRLSDTVYEMLIERSDARHRLHEFPAGNIVYVRFPGEHFSRAWHPFSVASCRRESRLRLIVKMLGHDTRHIAELREGDEIGILGPYSEFNSALDRDQVWVAGGVGIAPFIGLTHCFGVRKFGEVRLLYYTRASEPKMEAAELDGFMRNFPYFKWSQIRVPDEMLPDFGETVRTGKTLRNPVYLICGPQGFMRSARRALMQAGIPAADIRTEEFTPW